MSTQQAVQVVSLEGTRRSSSFLEAVWKFSKRKPMGAIGGVIIVVMILAAVFAGIISTHDPYRMNVSDLFAPPGARYWLGTDNFGRDIFSRIVWGSRVSLAVGVASVAVGATGGALLGLISGFLGGKFDVVSQRFVDILMAFPVLILALTVVAALGPSVENVTIAVALVMVPPGARVVRSAALAVREMQYVDAAHAVGARNFRILFVHILPNCLAPYIIVATVNLGWAIVVEASLSFLGLGTPPPQPSWGAMLSSEGRSYLEKAPWIGIFPGVAISLSVFGFNILGDALRDVWDPRLRR
ncbi:MAG: ABC transporter permease [Dehalococcoidia bacterium]|nr:ABC transporter permease [Dehalococcoidia bacterium]